MPPTMQIKRGTAAALAAVNPTPLAGELVWDANNNTLRVGNGSSAYSSLSIVSATPTDGSVTTAKIANDAVTYAKLQNVSATDRLLGRSSAGSGDVEEISCGSFGRSLIGSADAAAARSTLSVQPTASPAFTGTVTAAAVTLSGVLLVTAGSASAPGVAFSGDPDTGIAQLSAAGANTLSICTNSAERVRVDASGNVLVGATPSPAFSGVTPNLQAATTSFTGSDVDGGTIAAFGSSSFAVDRGAGVVFGFKYNTAGNYVTAARVRGAKENATDGNYAGYLAFDTRANAGNLTERMRIDSSGNVGIGVTPTHRLDCNGEFRLRGTGASTEAGKLHLYWVSATNRATWTTDASGNALIETGSSAPAERFRVGVNGRSQFFAASEKYGVQLNNGSTANGPFIGSDGADIFTISTSGGAERVRVNAAGEVLIGTTTDQGDFKLQVAGNTYLENLYLSTTVNYGRLAISHAGATTFAAGWNNTDTSSTGQTTLNILRNGVSVGTISTTNAATSYNTTSDYRLKANPRPITNATERIARIKPSQWDWHVGGVGEGFIAHELSEAVPLAVTGEKDAVDATGNPVWQTVDMSKVVPVLVAALQEANARIAALEERLNHA